LRTKETSSHNKGSDGIQNVVLSYKSGRTKRISAGWVKIMVGEETVFTGFVSDCTINSVVICTEDKADGIGKDIAYIRCEA